MLRQTNQQTMKIAVFTAGKSDVELARVFSRGRPILRPRTRVLPHLDSQGIGHKSPFLSGLLPFFTPLTSPFTESCPCHDIMCHAAPSGGVFHVDRGTLRSTHLISSGSSTPPRSAPPQDTLHRTALESTTSPSEASDDLEAACRASPTFLCADDSILSPRGSANPSPLVEYHPYDGFTRIFWPGPNHHARRSHLRCSPSPDCSTAGSGSRAMDAPMSNRITQDETR